uniref:Calcineurin-like phosphoesterase domain-containing protein n=1 Tax=Cyclophora tenuis TaxID=216820 RepID=A0A7S1GPX1_CYCTE
MSTTAFLVRHALKPRIQTSQFIARKFRQVRLFQAFPDHDSALLKTPLASLDSVKSFANKFYLQTTSEDDIPLRDGQRLVCVGDVHGDYTALCRFLKIAGVMNNNEQWCGGDSILVQCGDVLDRGSEELKCFSLLSRLSQQAPVNDGQVIVLWGNHEVLNSLGDFYYTTGDDEYQQQVGVIVDNALGSTYWRAQFADYQPSRWATYEPGGILAEPLLKNLKVAVKVGKTVCVHAGLTKRLLEENGGLTGMNQAAQTWIQQVHHKDFNNNFGHYTSEKEAIESAQQRRNIAHSSAPPVFLGGIGDSTPIWMRAYSMPADRDLHNPKTIGMLRDVLQELEAERLVMGHTVQSQINSAISGMAWRIDVGASKGVASGTPEVLEVIRQGKEEIVSILTPSGKLASRERHTVESLV